MLPRALWPKGYSLTYLGDAYNCCAGDKLVYAINAEDSKLLQLYFA